MSERQQSIGIGVLALITAGVAAVALTPVAVSVAPVAAYAPESSRTAGNAPEVLDPLQEEIRNALTSTSFPGLAPSLDNVNDGRAPEMLPGAGCLNPATLADLECSFGPIDATKTAVVVGDSIAASWLPGIRAALEPLGYRIYGLTYTSCPVADVQINVVNDPASTSRCNDGRQNLYEVVQDLKPDLVIGSDLENGLTRLASGATGEAAITEWSKGVASAATQLTSTGAKFVLLSSNPVGPIPSDCITRVSSPSTCVGSISQPWLDKQTAETSGMKSVPGAEYVDTQNWFCMSRKCPIFVGDNLVRWDGAHLTKQYSQTLGPKIAEVAAN